MLAVVITWAVRVEPPPVESTIPLATSLAPTPSGPLTVHVGGEVNAPGVYTLPAGSRIVDAVLAAGGATLKAETDAINMASPLVDAMQVLVPRSGTGAGPRRASTTLPAPPVGPKLINVNTATITELDGLPGVGPATAKAIVETRERNGYYQSADDLLDVPGIGPSKLAQIRALITW